MIKHSVISVMDGLIVEIFSCCSPFIMLHNGLEMGEYEACWLTGFALINSLSCNKKMIMVILKSQQKTIRKN